jgi:nanoRNase/pAp phosphatase (c-di-AMP/oligoRNAs hydrolase)
LITTHRNADPDALASTILLCHFILSQGKNCCIFFPEGLSGPSKRIVKQLNLKIPLCNDVDAEALVIVDASNSAQLGDLGGRVRFFKYVYLIDHHKPGDLSNMSTRYVINERATSNVQMIVLALEALGFKISDEKLATLALTGIIYDSRKFQIVDTYMLDAVKKLILWGGSYNTALEMLSAPREDLSLRMAKLKAAQRIRLGRACKEILIAVTSIGSFESKVAKSLIDLGADVAIVVGHHENEVRISIRVSKSALNRGVKASLLAEYLAEKLGGQGGGHEAAGMLHIKLSEPSEKIINELVEKIARSVPGKVARICIGSGGGSFEGEES